MSGAYEGSVSITFPLKLDVAYDPVALPSEIHMQQFVLIPKIADMTVVELDGAPEAVSQATFNKAPSFRFYGMSEMAEAVVRKNMCLPTKKIPPAGTALYLTDPAVAACLEYVASNGEAQKSYVKRSKLAAVCQPRSKIVVFAADVLKYDFVNKTGSPVAEVYVPLSENNQQARRIGIIDSEVQARTETLARSSPKPNSTLVSLACIGRLLKDHPSCQATGAGDVQTVRLALQRRRKRRLQQDGVSSNMRIEARFQSLFSRRSTPSSWS